MIVPISGGLGKGKFLYWLCCYLSQKECSVKSGWEGEILRVRNSTKQTVRYYGQSEPNAWFKTNSDFICLTYFIHRQCCYLETLAGWRHQLEEIFCRHWGYLEAAPRPKRPTSLQFHRLCPTCSRRCRLLVPWRFLQQQTWWRCSPLVAWRLDCLLLGVTLMFLWSKK